MNENLTISQRVAKNVMIICKAYKIKIGILEVKSKISVGYLSRVNSTKKGISLNSAYELSKNISKLTEQTVTVDDLINKDYEAELVKKVLINRREELEKQINAINNELKKY